MTQPASQFESKEYDASISVIEAIRANGHIAYLAGGCVRDLLLGVEPKDFDVATDAKPAEIKAYFKKTASVGAAFGVMLVRDFGVTIEVATFRSDGVYSDARRPDSIEFSSPQEDAKRRDFTINALFFDPFADEAHRVIDFVDGLGDVEGRVLRAVGDPNERLREDHLRALRAIRFAAKYELEIEDGTKRAISEHARALSGVSVERIGEEVRKMLLHSTRVRACELIDELGLDDAIFGDICPIDPTVMGALDELVEYPLALVALVLGRPGVDDIDAVCTRYRRALDLSNTDRDSMRSILKCVNGFENHWGALNESGRKRLSSREWATRSLVILGAMDRERACVIRSEIEQLSTRFGGLSPDALVNGADLIELGLSPGPVFKAILDEVYNEQLEGRVQTRDQAIGFAQRRSESEETEK